MTTDTFTFTISNSHMDVNALGAESSNEGEDFMFAHNGGGVGLVGEAEVDDSETADRTQNNSCGNVFLLGDRLYRLAQVAVRGKANGKGLKSTRFQIHWLLWHIPQ